MANARYEELDELLARRNLGRCQDFGLHEINRLLSQTSPSEVCSAIRKMHCFLEEMRTEEKKPFRVAELRKLFDSGQFQVRGRSKDGRLVDWQHFVAGSRSVRDLTTSRLYYAWFFLWVLRLNCAQNGGAPRMSVVYDDPDRSALDFNWDLLKWQTEFAASMSMFQPPGSSVCWVCRSKTGELMIKQIVKCLPRSIRKVITITSRQEVLDLLQDPQEIPSSFKSHGKPFVLSYDRSGDYWKLFEKRGFESISVSDFNNLNIGPDQLATLRQETSAWEASNATNQQKPKSAVSKLEVLETIMEGSDTLSDVTEDPEVTDGPEDQPLKPWGEGESLF